MNQKELFAEHLRSAMEQKQMKQVDLVHAADQAGLKVGKSHISQYVSGKTLPRATIRSLLFVILVNQANLIMSYMMFVVLLWMKRIVWSVMEQIS